MWLIRYCNICRVCCSLLLRIHTHSAGAPHPMNACVAHSVVCHVVCVVHSFCSLSHIHRVLIISDEGVCGSFGIMSYVVCVARCCGSFTHIHRVRIHTHSLCAPHPMNMCVSHSVLCHMSCVLLIAVAHSHTFIGCSSHLRGPTGAPHPQGAPTFMVECWSTQWTE